MGVYGGSHGLGSCLSGERFLTVWGCLAFNSLLDWLFLVSFPRFWVFPDAFSQESRVHCMVELA